MTLYQYIDIINQRYLLGNATEHTFRGDLQQLIESLAPDVRATNEPKRQKCGAPDYIITKKDTSARAGEIPVGFVEAKDIGDTDLEGAKKNGNKEQFDRYKASLNNIIFTDYLNFLFYRDGQFITKIAIAELSFPSAGGVPNGRGGLQSAGGVPGGRGGLQSTGGVPGGRGGLQSTGSVPNGRGGLQSTGSVPNGRGGIKPLPENFAQFENLMRDFCSTIGQTIKSTKKLSQMMAGKARLLADVIEKSLNSDEQSMENSTLRDQMEAFKQILIHDITPKSFADVYAQTIAYGMFAARLHDPSLDNFSRQEAYELIPKSNPFLKKLFGYIAGLDVDDRIKWIVDDLVSIFLACNVQELLKDYGKGTKMEDPIIHFYEDFLSEYDPALRKARGVWYTPQPVVNFIVRAVDDILKTEFGLPQGLADTSKTTIKVDVQGKMLEKEVHRVQILDPATGTGTFLAEVVKLIHKKFEGQQGIWSNYVENHLLPRLNGFELLMASYAMAHLKLDLLLTETGYKTTPPSGHPSSGGEYSSRGGNQHQRIRVYLTNSLEEHHPDTGTLFASWLSTEANEANRIKRDTPVMVVMGNPPYSVSSSNKGEWIQNLIADYKKDLNERKINLDDDYIKFIRYGQHFIDKNGSGVLAYISNNSFIDGITHRQMRKHLLESFDKIYILDLHGNAKKKEVCPDGSPDQNVFDIMQGVSINLLIKNIDNRRNKSLAQVYHFDLQGKRADKYDFLSEKSLNSIDWITLKYYEPNYFFVPKNFSEESNYNEGFKVSEILINQNSGIQTKCDDISIQLKKNEIEYIIEKFKSLSIPELKAIFKNKKESSGWSFDQAKQSLYKDDYLLLKINYRPFDNRFIAYTYNSGGFIGRPRYTTMKHLINKKNISILFCRQQSSFDFQHIFLTNLISDLNSISLQTKEQSYQFPLYLYPDANGQQSIEQKPPRHLQEPPRLSATPPAEGNEEMQLSAIPAEGNNTARLSGAPAEGNEESQLSAIPAEGNRIPNLNMEIVNKIANKIGLTFTPEKHSPPLAAYPYNSPPVEGCPQGGVALEGCPQGGVVLEECPQGGVVLEERALAITQINNIPIRRNFIDGLPYNPALSQLANEKRKAGILSEVLFWQQVHKGMFHSIDFDRQRIIGSFIVDFYVKTLGLVVEIDGSSHDDKVEYDEARQRYLESLGLRVFRISDYDVKNNLNAVMLGLEEYIVREYGEEPPRLTGNEEPPRLSATPPKEGNKTTGSTKHSPPVEGCPTGGVAYNPVEGCPQGGVALEDGGVAFAPIDILDYIYAVLHSPTYREKYKEFLKIDFPRVPYPKDANTFWQLVKLGGELRQIHLLESATVEKYITQYPEDGDNVVTKPHFKNSTPVEVSPQASAKNSPPLEGCPKGGVVLEECPEGGEVGRVYINDTQYFAGVPEVAWNFYIGGYQPAQKWLKDRKGRALEFDDILHYQKIIVALTETDRLMKEIDIIEID